jgi:hypothetical protein
MEVEAGERREGSERKRRGNKLIRLASILRALYYKTKSKVFFYQPCRHSNSRALAPDYRVKHVLVRFSRFRHPGFPYVRTSAGAAVASMNHKP